MMLYLASYTTPSVTVAVIPVKTGIQLLWEKGQT
jgi:hypothetical protein